MLLIELFLTVVKKTIFNEYYFLTIDIFKYLKIVI